MKNTVKKMFLVNRHTGETLKLEQNNNGNLPPHEFFHKGNFLKDGQIVELLELEESEDEYFGIMYRSDKLKVLRRGRLVPHALEKLD